MDGPDLRPQPHGYGLEPGLHAALRGDVPVESVRWVESELGGSVVGQAALEGGNSSAIHRLTVARGAGEPTDVVLRRYVLDWVEQEPEIPGNEALTLTLLSARPEALAPRLLAADLDRSHNAVPTVLMSVVPGAVDWRPTDLDDWLRRLAEQLLVIHALPTDPRQSSWAPYAPEPGLPPSWTRHPRAWETALERWHAGPPPGERVFLHRDYHPGNLLWTDDRLTGVVDWASSCAGPPEEDVAHCRANLAGHFDLATADRFLAHWLELTGRDGYDHGYDLTDVVSFAGDESSKLDAFVAAAAAALG